MNYRFVFDELFLNACLSWSSFWPSVYWWWWGWGFVVRAQWSEGLHVEELFFDLH